MKSYHVFIFYTLRQEWCRENFVNSRNMGLVSEVRGQLRDICIKVHTNLIWCWKKCEDNNSCDRFFLFDHDLLSVILQMNMKLESSQSDLANVRRCLAHGLFTNAAQLQPDGSYVALDTLQAVAIHPSSVLFQAKPAYVVFNELLHTSRCYMRDLCLVDGDWLQEAAPEYFRRKLRATKS